MQWMRIGEPLNQEVESKELIWYGHIQHKTSQESDGADTTISVKKAKTKEDMGMDEY